MAKQIRIEGIERVKITTDGSKVETYKFSGVDRGFHQAIIDSLRSWRFQRHDPISFESTFRFRLEFSGCRADPHDAIRTWRTKTDSNGRFSIPATTEGLYRLTLSLGGFETTFMQIRLVPDALLASLELAMTELPAALLLPATTEAAIPIFPESAIANGTEGQVVVRILRQGFVEAISGPIALRSAALENAMTWRFDKPVPIMGFEIKYEFQLLQSDCKGSPDKVSIKFPSDVSLVACRQR